MNAGPLSSHQASGVLFEKDAPDFIEDAGGDHQFEQAKALAATMVLMR
jgi:hypothetical protein